jgi:hypothetical protein
MSAPRTKIPSRSARAWDVWNIHRTKLLLELVTFTRASLDNGLPSFPIQNLPTTLRDAITICRNLNFQYLWIDALCIIQDSLLGEDWVIEFGKMYGNAALTIAASGAQDTSEGVQPTSIRG